VKYLYANLILILFLMTQSFPVFAQQTQKDILTKVNALAWLRSQSVPVANVATVALLPDTKALGTADTSTFLELQGNPPSQDDYAISAENYRWFGVFSFDPSGYVKDDEKIDPDDLLRSLKASNANDVEDRKRRGLQPLYLDGWYVQPHYDLETKRLEWGVKFHSDNGSQTVNYQARLLGRSGVMTALLVSSPETLDQDVQSFHSLLKRFNFIGGQQYYEFKQGDKVAEYGLAALVVGGTAAVAAKTGAGFFKIIGLAVVAFVAGVWKFVKGLFARKKAST
jgi:uncharacterized membrane-anchored protein